MNTECPICLEPIGETNVMTTECGHTFHASCMIKNLRVSAHCPMCRGVLDHEHRHAERDRRQREEGLWINFTDDDVDELVDLLTERNGRNLTAAEESVNDILSASGDENDRNHVDRIHTRIRDYVSEVVYDFTHMLREWANEGENIETDEPPPPPPPPPPIDHSPSPVEIYEENNLYNNSLIDTNINYINSENQPGLSLSQIEYLLMND